MTDEAIARLLGSWEDAYWRYRTTGFGLGDIGVSIEAEHQIIEEWRPRLRKGLEENDSDTLAELRWWLEDQGMLTPEFGQLLAVAAPTETSVLYESSNFGTVCTVVAPDFKGIHGELFSYFARNPAALYNLAPRELEELLSSVFRNHGYRTELGPGWGDGGVDLRLLQKDSVGEIFTLVQIRRYAPMRPIRLEAVAALYGVVESENASRGLFVTTSYYLPSARRFAALTHGRLILADSTDVARWCALATRGKVDHVEGKGLR